MAEKKGLTRQSVLDAAVQLVEEAGWEGLSLQELARRLQIKTASLYNHIQGIGEVRQFIALLALEQLDAALRDAAVGRSHLDALEAVALAYRAFAHAHPHLYSAVIASASLEDPTVEESRRRVMWVLSKVLEPYCPPDELLFFNRGLRSLMHGFLSLEAAGFFKKGHLDESYRFSIQAFMAALPKEANHE